MMDHGTPLASRVSTMLEDPLYQSGPMFSPAALEAMRLADLFAAVSPAMETLPLDALAGFPAASTEIPERGGAEQ